MTPRTLGLVIGVVYLGLGVPGMLAPYFPANPGLTVVHLAMGAWGLAAFAGWSSAHAFARAAAYAFALLGLAGMVQGIDRLVMPLYGPNMWLHLFTASLAGFVAWGSGERRFVEADRRRSATALIAVERRNGIYERRKASAA